jgi:hypothetical protein
MGLRAVGLYLFTTVFAVCLGLIAVNIIQPGKAITTETREQMLTTYGMDAGKKQQEAATQTGGGHCESGIYKFFDAAGDLFCIVHGGCDDHASRTKNKTIQEFF